MFKKLRFYVIANNRTTFGDSDASPMARTRGIRHPNCRRKNHLESPSVRLLLLLLSVDLACASPIL